MTEPESQAVNNWLKEGFRIIRDDCNSGLMDRNKIPAVLERMRIFAVYFNHYYPVVIPGTFADDVTNFNHCLKNYLGNNNPNVELYIRGRLPSQSGFNGGSMMYKNKTYKVHIGERGGKYITVNKKKLYL